MSNLFDPALIKTRELDRQRLATTQLPIVTLSATYREDLKGLYGLPNSEKPGDVVFSRAHFSMALAIAETAWNGKPKPAKAWVVDPTNYVSSEDWLSVIMTERIGKNVARHQLLKVIKDLIDRFGRKKLPFMDSITTPLLYLTELTHQPILSIHTTVGNFLAGQGKTVIQLVTDPHARADYLDWTELPTKYLFVFNERTKTDLLEMAAELDKTVDPERIVVTGPPVDPRILKARSNKHVWKSGPLRLCITTGGLGTNKEEILQILNQLLPAIKHHRVPIQLLVYAGTHKDIYDAALQLVSEHQLTVASLAHQEADVRVIYHPQIVNANELLLEYGFPWAHGFITKPSGDMAYDAAAAGCFLLTLTEWGEWEEQVRVIFEQLGLARRAKTENIVEQLEVLMGGHHYGHSWMETAGQAAWQLPPLFLNGCDNIIEQYHKITKELGKHP